jgi:bifunctional pyridoxal-dependent enzyme with beta-cystathionase and maltose regulon repressor activities
VLVLTSPQSRPTGPVLPRSELEAIPEVCAEHGAQADTDEIRAAHQTTSRQWTPAHRGAVLDRFAVHACLCDDCSGPMTTMTAIAPPRSLV